MRMAMISAAVAVMASRGGLAKERDGGRDEAHVGERLREISHRRPGRPFEFLAEEAHVVRVAGEALEPLSRPLVLAGIGEVFHRPEAARREGVLAAVHAVGI